MISPYSLTKPDFVKAALEHCGRGSLHATHLYEEWWRKGEVTGSHAIFNNAGKLKEELLSLAQFQPPELVASQSDGDTKKILLRTEDQLEIESVIIPMQTGLTLCVSSQVGCRLGCTFCETGRMGLVRHLTVGEITAQLWAARHLVGAKIRNVVFMGMGEPFDNYENVIGAARVLIDPHGGGIGPRHVTLSTSGRLDGIERLEKEANFSVNLAVSLNAPNEMLRRQLMPITRKYGMEKIYQAIARYNQTTGREVMIAYVLIRGINDQMIHARQLAEYLQGLKVKVNLIPYNPQSHDPMQRPEDATAYAFKAILKDAGYQVLLRLTKGDDIMAACGQLGNQTLRKSL